MCAEQHFDKRRQVSLSKLPEHSPAWSITIHRSQGSEYKNVVVVLPKKADSPLATRQLLYTAITRAKKSLFLFGSTEVIEKAVAELHKATAADPHLRDRVEAVERTYQVQGQEIRERVAAARRLIYDDARMAVKAGELAVAESSLLQAWELLHKAPAGNVENHVEEIGKLRGTIVEQREAAQRSLQSAEQASEEFDLATAREHLAKAAELERQHPGLEAQRSLIATREASQAQAVEAAQAAAEQLASLLRTRSWRAAEELIAREQVDVLSGTFLSHVGLAVADLARQRKMFFLAGEPLTDKIVWQNGNRYTYRLRTSTYMQVAMLVPEAVAMKKKRWAIVYPNYEYGQSAAASFKELLKAAQPDVEFVAEQAPPLGKVDSGSVVQAMADADVDGITPVHWNFLLWRNPETRATRSIISLMPNESSLGRGGRRPRARRPVPSRGGRVPRSRSG